MSEDRLLDAHDVAGILNVPVSWVRQHSTSGEIPHLQLGRYKRYRREEVLGWLERQASGGRSMSARSRRDLHAA